MEQATISLTANNNSMEITKIDLNKSIKIEDSHKPVTYFEDLSNELIYEIFDVLDFCDIYDAFSNLNKRLQNLLTDSNFPIKVYLLLISKSKFNHIHKHIIIPYQHRIISLHLSNPFMSELVCSSNFIRLEKLILMNIESINLDKFLRHLIFLTGLVSLTIDCSYSDKNINIFYRQIIRFPALKYCNVSINTDLRSYEPLEIATSEFSPIEYLIIKNSCNLHEMYVLLLYFPKLRRLSLHNLNNSRSKPIRLNPIMLNYLTHVNLNISYITFDEFELMIKSFFSKLEVLYLSVQSDETYLNANQWEQLIVSYMPYLRIFDVNINERLSSSKDIKEYIPLFEQFHSLFWLERQWFFEDYLYSQMGNTMTLHSINPYRRKKYTLCDRRDHPDDQINHVDSVKYIEIENEKAIIKCVKYFPNVTEISLCCTHLNEYCLSTALNRLMPLKQLTKLVIHSYTGRFSKLIDLLYCTPNIHTFSIGIGTGRLYSIKDLMLCEQSEIFQLISKNNKIKELNIISEYRLEYVQVLVKLCSRLEHVTLKSLKDSVEPVLRFLLLEDNNRLRRLSSICIKGNAENHYNTVTALIRSENLSDISLCITGTRTWFFTRIYLWL